MNLHNIDRRTIYFYIKKQARRTHYMNSWSGFLKKGGQLYLGTRFKNLAFSSITETFRATGDGRGHLRRK